MPEEERGGSTKMTKLQEHVLALAEAQDTGAERIREAMAKVRL